MAGTKKQPRRQTKNANTASSGSRGWHKKVLIIGVGLAVIGVALFFSMGDSMASERMRMEEYLNDKYGQEFVVKNVRVTGAGLGVKGAWRGDAYPKSDPSLGFEIRRDQTTDKVDYETFLQTLWTKQGTSEVEDFLSREFPDREYYSLRISPGNSPGNPLYDLIQGETPSLDDALKNHKDVMVYELVINDVVQVTPEEPSEALLEKVVKVVDFVRSKEVRAPSIHYGYRDSSFTERNRWDQQRYQYRIKLEREQLRDISAPSDLKQYFEKITS